MMKITTSYVMSGLEREVSVMHCHAADLPDCLQYEPGSVITINSAGATIREPWCELAGYAHRRVINVVEVY